MRIRFLAGLALALSLGVTSAQAQNISRQISVDKDFAEIPIAYSGQPRAYTMLVKVIVVGGKLELCGIGEFSSVQFRENIKRGLRRSKFRVNGQIIAKRMDFFTTVNKRGGLRKGKANCRASGVAAPRSIETIDIDWGDFTAR